MSLIDQMLSDGSALHVEAFHGDAVEILDGPLAGKKFVGVVEVESDATISTVIGEDFRPKRVLRFREGTAPMIPNRTTVKHQGRTWMLNRYNSASYLSNDYEMTELTSQDA